MGVTKGDDALPKFVAWSRTAFYLCNNVARNKIASNSHDTLRDFVAGNSCAQQVA